MVRSDWKSVQIRNAIAEMEIASAFGLTMIVYMGEKREVDSAYGLSMTVYMGEKRGCFGLRPRNDGWWGGWKVLGRYAASQLRVH